MVSFDLPMRLTAHAKTYCAFENDVLHIVSATQTNTKVVQANSTGIIEHFDFRHQIVYGTVAFISPDDEIVYQRTFRGAGDGPWRRSRRKSWCRLENGGFVPTGESFPTAQEVPRKSHCKNHYLIACHTPEIRKAIGAFPKAFAKPYMEEMIPRECILYNYHSEVAKVFALYEIPIGCAVGNLVAAAVTQTKIHFFDLD